MIINLRLKKIELRIRLIKKNYKENILLICLLWNTFSRFGPSLYISLLKKYSLEQQGKERQHREREE